MILIFSEQGDVHADAVEKNVRHKGGRVCRLNREEVHRWSLECLRGEPLLVMDGQQTSVEKITSIFIRALPDLAAFRGQSPTAAGDISEYVADQRFSHFSECLTLMSECSPTVNSIAASSRARSKALQLCVAGRIGFQVPHSYTGADPEIARKQIASLQRGGKRVCTKAISGRFLTLDGQQFTRFTELLDDGDLAELESLRECPITIQEYVEKAYELRVCLVGERAFACRIDSQAAGGRTAIDWRQYDIPNTPHTKYDLPLDIAEKLQAFHAYFGLSFSCFDMVRSADGAYVFLEANPFGRWLWIEDLTGLEITSAIADTLLQAGRGMCTAPSRTTIGRGTSHR